MRIGVLTGGGDGPGLNAVIRSVTKSLIRQCGAQVLGIEDGFMGLLQRRVRPLDWRAVSGLIHLGGTVLGTSNRGDPTNHEGRDCSPQVVAYARELGLDAVVAIGGDGTMRIAHALSRAGLPVVGVPKTIDNDIVGCERSFGFDTAVAIAAEALERLQTTGQSHGRIMLLETMGRDAGWIALEAGLAAGADVILLPEIPFDVQAVAAVCRERETRQRFTVVCVAEGAHAAGAGKVVEERIEGRPQPERLGGIANWLRLQLQPLVHSEVRATVLGHVQRGGAPTAFDRVLATQYGNQAAQLVLQRRFDHMVTLQGGVLASVPLSAVDRGCRRVPADHPLLTCARQIGVSLGEG